MDSLQNNWPVILVVLGLVLLFLGLLRRLVKLAIFAVAIGVLGAVLLPLIRK